MLNPLERLSFAAQLQKRLPLQIEQVLFADGRLMGQCAACENVGERSSDDGIVIADAAGAPREVDTQLERSDRATARGYAGSLDARYRVAAGPRCRSRR